MVDPVYNSQNDRWVCFYDNNDDNDKPEVKILPQINEGFRLDSKAYIKALRVVLIPGYPG